MTFAFLFNLMACKNEPYHADVIQLDWVEGQEFFIATSHRNTAEMTETVVVSLEDYVPVDPLGESWSDEVIWTYQVIEADFYPTPDDELFEYAINGAGAVVPLTVIQVTLDPTLNTDPVLLEQDPVSYLVFRSQRNRLAGLVQFQTIDGLRQEVAYSSHQLNTSWSVLSQSNMGLVSTYLAPFGLRWSGGERILENNSVAESKRIDLLTTDVVFDDVTGGSLVSARYEMGLPWPSMTMTENMTARLLTESEVDALRGAPMALSPSLPEAFDYRASLRASIDLDRMTKLHEDIINLGELEGIVDEAYRPWAGFWWPLKGGELVLGFKERPTFSQQILDEVKPLKEEMDALSEEMRNLKKEEEADEELLKEKKDSYNEKQSALIEKLVEFYSGLQTDLDSGKIIIEDGKIKKAEDGENPGWEYEINRLSPMDKFALLEYLNGNSRHNPFYLSAWELLNSYNPGGESWWGHCNGWAAAAILTNEPRQNITVNTDKGDIVFEPADIKGLLTESHYSTQSHFYGERYRDENSDISDLSPAHFQSLISFYLKDQGVPFVFDTTASEAVWNYPVWEAFITAEKKNDPESKKVNINLATVEALSELEAVSEELANGIVKHRETNGNFQSLDELEQVEGYSEKDHADLFRILPLEIVYEMIADVRFTDDNVDHTYLADNQAFPEWFMDKWFYTITVDEEGTILSSQWEDENEHPDFAWVPYHNSKTQEVNGSENPYLVYGDILDHLGSDLER